MYNFVDTRAVTVANNDLPTEALSFNGQWFDRAVPGFRTLSVTGRESMQAEITCRERTTANGQRFIRRQYPVRVISVKFQIKADTAAAFRTAFNTLNKLLDPSESRIIFNDESDKFFVGTRTEISNPEAGLNSVIAEITFTCSDPFKYDTEYTTQTINRTQSASFNANTVVGTPAIITITPAFNAISLQMSGVATSTATGADSPITVKNIKNGKVVVIDGEKCTVKEDGANKFADMDFWEFPTVKPGNNSVIVNTDVCNISIKYRACYI